MLTTQQREQIAQLLRRKLADYDKDDVYCPGKILFNFQLNATINPNKPFSEVTNNKKPYEKLLAEYFCGKAVEINTNNRGISNNKGIVVIRGATGSGKTSAINKAVALAEELLAKANTNAKLDIIYIEYNNIPTVYQDENDENYFNSYLWRQFASEIEYRFEQHRTNLNTELFEFMVWLRANHTLQAELPNVFRYLERNREYLLAVNNKTGYGCKTVDEIRTILEEDWRTTVSKMEDREIAIHKLAWLKFYTSLEKHRDMYRAMIIDNVDALPPSLQRAIVDTAIWIADFLNVRLLIAVRPLTWQNQQGHLTLDVEDHKAPSIADVICKRLEYISKYDLQDQASQQAIAKLIEELRMDNSHLRNLLYGISGIGLRAALRNFGNFLGSVRIEPPEIGNRNYTSVRPSGLARALFFGAEEYISHENIEGLYCVNLIRNARLSLLKPRILDYLIRVKGGREKLKEIVDFCEAFGFSREEIRNAVNELMLRRRALLWSDNLYELKEIYDKDLDAIFAIAPKGASYYKRLFGEYLYTEACLATSSTEEVNAVTVVSFSRDLIYEDERQINYFLARKKTRRILSSIRIRSPIYRLFILEKI